MILKYISDLKYTEISVNNLWFPIFKIAQLKEAKAIRILGSFFMNMGKDVLL